MLQNKQKILEEVGLSRDSLDNVVVNKQKVESESIAECLGGGLTSANTLDISTFFKSPKKTAGDVSVSSDVFDDDFDDIVKDLDF